MSADRESSLTFLGAAGTVTGSRFLVESGRSRVLLDCGLYQGRDVEQRNWDAPPFEPSALDAIVLTHAHLDHSGWVPVLAKRGFRGTVHCTRGTADLLGILWMDAARLEEQDASYANRKGYSRHRPALPLFDTDDVQRALRLVERHGYHERFAAAPGIEAYLRRAGHILGSATVELTLADGTVLLASGDLGRRDQPILRDPEPAAPADVVLVESTYGDRTHEPGADERLATALCQAAERGGAILVPSFAVGRAQSLVWTLDELSRAGRIPKLAVYLDSPMALRVSAATCRHREDHDREMREASLAERCPLCAGDVRPVATVEESIALNAIEGPFIVIAGSGMLQGGRIVHHLAQRAADPRTTVLVPGFQAEGTRGRALVEGARTLRLFGRDVEVRAHVEQVEGYSAHADREDLLRWLSEVGAAPRRVHVVHGEPAQSAGLARAIGDRLGWPVNVPSVGDRVGLGD